MDYAILHSLNSITLCLLEFSLRNYHPCIVKLGCVHRQCLQIKPLLNGNQSIQGGGDQSEGGGVVFPPHSNIDVCYDCNYLQSLSIHVNIDALITTSVNFLWESF